MKFAKSLWCMCGNIFNVHSQDNNSICNKSCPGNSSQTCGGFIGSKWYASIYATNYSNNCKLVKQKKYKLYYILTPSFAGARQ